MTRAIVGALLLACTLGPSGVATAATDRTPPAITVTQRPATATNLTTATIAFTVADNSGRVKSVTCSRDGAAYAACTSPVTLSGLAAGARRFAVRATDYSSNTSTATVGWTIDKTPPTVKLTATPASSTAATSATFSFTGSDAGAGVAGFLCSLDKATYAACKSPVSYTNLAAAVHVFALYATDKAGNTGSSASWTWTVTPAPPSPPTAPNSFISDTGVYSYKSYLNRSYGPAPQNVLDIYVPTVTNVTSMPVVVYIHGGAYVAGDKQDYVDWYQALARRGIAAVLVNYRLGNDNFEYTPGDPQLEDMIYDVKGALRWIVANAATYKLNPDYLFVMGDSAGGHLTSLLATTVGMAQFEGTIGGNPNVMPRIAGLIDVYGPTDVLSEDSYLQAHPSTGLADMYRAVLGNCDPQTKCADRAVMLSSANKTSPTSAPALILHGTADPLVPTSQSQKLYDGLIAAGVPARIVWATGYGHDPQVFYDWGETIFTFIKNVSQGRLPF